MEAVSKLGQKKVKTFHFISEAPLLHIHLIILILILFTDFQVLYLDIRHIIVVMCSRQVLIVSITAVVSASNRGLG